MKFFIRLTTYFLLLILLSYLFAGVAGTAPALLLFALLLTVLNGSIRPVLTFIALPLNLITMGVASVFVNMLTLWIADAITAGAFIQGFWLMALSSVCVMAADALGRAVRLRSVLNDME